MPDTLTSVVQNLGLRAGLFVDLNGRPYPQSHTAEDSVKAYKKFAELVVEECLDILEDEDTHDIYSKSLRFAAIRIKKHFGVEP